MAVNRVYKDGEYLAVAVTHPATPSAGDPVRYGQRPGVALTDEDAAGLTSVQFGGVYTMSVRGVNGSGNSAVAAGDALYYVDADDPVLSKKDTGVLFGYAHGTITAGQTADIPVKVLRT